jgi:carbon-monoxide dehydrogenase large subunit
MNLQNDPHSLALMKFGIGQPVRRTEDPTLVRGAGRYTDDVKLPNEAYAVMVRSRVAHGVIKGIDTAAARTMPGVLGVYTGADLAEYGTLKCIVPFNNRDGTPMRKPPRPALPTDKVRFVGDPVACVVAETLLQAKDAAEAVAVEIESLPAVIRPEQAVAPGAPLIHDEAPGNVALDYHYGDAGEVAAAFAKAAHVTRLKLVNSRVVVNAMEPRAACSTQTYSGNGAAFMPNEPPTWPVRMRTCLGSTLRMSAMLPFRPNAPWEGACRVKRPLAGS